MKLHLTLTVSVLAVAMLAACDSPTPPTMTEADLIGAEAAARRAAGLTVTPSNELPRGTVDYSGRFGAQVWDAVDGTIVADMDLTVAFARDTVSGSIHNINFFDDDGRPDQLLGGQLAITGTEDNGALAMTAQGRLDGVEGRMRGNTNVHLNMAGDVRTDAAAGDTISGRAHGQGQGDFDIQIVNGMFYAN